MVSSCAHARTPFAATGGEGRLPQDYPPSLEYCNCSSPTTCVSGSSHRWHLGTDDGTTDRVFRIRELSSQSGCSHRHWSMTASSRRWLQKWPDGRFPKVCEFIFDFVGLEVSWFHFVGQVGQSGGKAKLRSPGVEPDRRPDLPDLRPCGPPSRAARSRININRQRWAADGPSRRGRAPSIPDSGRAPACSTSGRGSGKTDPVRKSGPAEGGNDAPGASIGRI